jgi:hypothetical protein
MTRYSRAEWGARPSKGGPGNLTASQVEGIALHWPAMSRPLRGREAVAAALRGWQNYHMDGHGWSDIAYQVAVDQDGNRYELRGLATTSGANGDGDVNARFGAALLILAPGEEPTGAMVTEVRNVIADHRRLFPNSRRIVGHGQIRPDGTACPGPAAQRLIDAGAFEPTNEGDDMALDDKVNDDRTVRQVLRRLDNFITRSDKRHKAMLAHDRSLTSQLAALREAVDNNADKAEIKAMLNNLDATIQLVINEESA